MKKYKVNKEKCAGCGSCVQLCPTGAIKMGKDGKAFIDQDVCQVCGECMEVCPFGAIELVED